MTPTISQYATALEELSTEKGSLKATELAENFIAFLKRRGEKKKLGAIVAYLEKKEREKRGEINVRVITAHEVSKGAKEKLEAKAAKLFPGKKVELRYETDKDVIGGALFRTDETLYDATLSTELKELKKRLKK